jgi:Protein of unknown function (DUF1254)
VAGVPVPSIAETKAIAEEGFIFGLPIVMNYAVQYAYAVDRDSGQFKAPFNQINNEARVFTYQDTAIVTPNSDTPYSMLWLDLRAEPMVLSVPSVEKNRYYSVQLIDSNTHNYVGGKRRRLRPSPFRPREGHSRRSCDRRSVRWCYCELVSAACRRCASSVAAASSCCLTRASVLNAALACSTSEAPPAAADTAVSPRPQATSVRHAMNARITRSIS